MIIIGELINASRKAIGTAIVAQDTAAIQKVAADQKAAGANFIDVNAGIYVEREPEYLAWLVQTVQQVVDGPCAIDSPSPKAIEAALAVHQGTPMINSISRLPSSTMRPRYMMAMRSQRYLAVARSWVMNR